MSRSHPTPPRPAPSLRLPRMHWGVGVALVYLTFAASTVGFVAFALRHPVELVTADYYEQSLEHDARLAATHRTRALGEALRVELDAAGGDLLVALPAAAVDAAGTITLYRPSDEKADRVVPVLPARADAQRVPLAGVAAGHWIVRVAWRSRGLDYFHEQRIVRP